MPDPSAPGRRRRCHPQPGKRLPARRSGSTQGNHLDDRSSDGGAMRRLASRGSWRTPGRWSSSGFLLRATRRVRCGSRVSGDAPPADVPVDPSVVMGRRGWHLHRSSSTAPATGRPMMTMPLCARSTSRPWSRRVLVTARRHGAGGGNHWPRSPERPDGPRSSSGLSFACGQRLREVRRRAGPLPTEPSHFEHWASVAG